MTDNQDPKNVKTLIDSKETSTSSTTNTEQGSQEAAQAAKIVEQEAEQAAQKEAERQAQQAKLQELEQQKLAEDQAALANLRAEVEETTHDSNQAQTSVDEQTTATQTAAWPEIHEVEQLKRVD